RVRRQVPEFLSVHGSDLEPGDWQTWDGIPVTTPRRTIADCAVTGLGPALIGQALEEGVRKGLFTAEEAEHLRRPFS
ncbi:MAG TPA: hypothetical protein VL025_18445, partial [Thermoanaerobaculia bacterium]|nr:hypothetical protein [Thermoanaerobaculia bacterium]